MDTAAIVRAVGDGVSPAHVSRALQMLEQDGWVELQHEMGSAGPIAATPLPKALVEARGWPTPGAEATEVVARLLQALDEAIARTDDPEEKSRLQRLRAAAGDAGKSVLAEAIVAAGKVVAGG